MLTSAQMQKLMTLYVMLSVTGGKTAFQQASDVPGTSNLDVIRQLVTDVPGAGEALAEWVSQEHPGHNSDWQGMHAAVANFVDSTGTGWSGPNCPKDLSMMIGWLRNV